MKNTNRIMTIAIGIIMALGGFVCTAMHSIFTCLALEAENNFSFETEDGVALFVGAAIVFAVCGVAELINGIIIVVHSKHNKPKKLTYVLNIVVIALSAVLLLLTAMSGKADLMPIQMLTGIIIPVLYFIIYFISYPQSKTK